MARWRSIDPFQQLMYWIEYLVDFYARGGLAATNNPLTFEEWKSK